MTAKRPEITIYCKCCDICCFKVQDTLSGYPCCNFPDLIQSDNPDAMEVIRAIRHKTIPESCKLRGGVLFDVDFEEEV